MKHAATRTLYDYWSRLRGSRTAPARTEIEPGDIRHILGDTFILEAGDRQTYTYRLAGTRLCAAYCRELKGRNFLDNWVGKDREAIACLLAAIVEDGAAAIIGLECQNDRGQKMPVEIMLLPLKHEGPHHTRILGCFAPLDQPYWLGLYPVMRQPILSLRLIWPDERPSFIRRGDQVPAIDHALGDVMAVDKPAHARPAVPRRAPAEGRRIGHLTVIDGGRQ
ncbi:PAS domain-containing protein [Chthonobacter albigriseus]|uniref:PAS domain-containing protein n=1 Tax=Chthonobacter albigriseus TaxID=1683161 RepID=UPI0019D631DC|nr:PAS domain-containing protein [Chthonobacter albigriseus]